MGDGRSGNCPSTSAGTMLRGETTRCSKREEGVFEVGGSRKGTWKKAKSSNCHERCGMEILGRSFTHTILDRAHRLESRAFLT